MSLNLLSNLVILINNFRLYFWSNSKFVRAYASQCCSYVTDVTAEATAVDPFTILAQCPNAKEARFSAPGNWAAPTSPQHDHSKLTLLSINRGVFSYNSVKHLLSSFPALTKLNLLGISMPGFDEEDFVRFLENKHRAIAKLKYLRICGPEEITGRTLCTLLRNSNLEECNYFNAIEFSASDLRDFKDIADGRGMTIIPFYRHENLGSYFSCKNGSHTFVSS